MIIITVMKMKIMTVVLLAVSFLTSHARQPPSPVGDTPPLTLPHPEDLRHLEQARRQGQLEAQQPDPHSSRAAGQGRRSSLRVLGSMCPGGLLLRDSVRDSTKIPRKHVCRCGCSEDGRSSRRWGTGIIRVCVSL